MSYILTVIITLQICLCLNPSVLTGYCDFLLFLIWASYVSWYIIWNAGSPKRSMYAFYTNLPTLPLIQTSNTSRFCKAWTEGKLLIYLNILIYFCRDFLDWTSCNLGKQKDLYKLGTISNEKGSMNFGI